MLLVGDVIAGGWNVRLMYWTVSHSLQGSRGHVLSDHFVYPARLMSSDCAMLIVSSQVATSMGWGVCELCASHISLFAFRFRLSRQCEDMIRSFPSAPHSPTLPAPYKHSLARSLVSLLVRSLARFSLPLASPNPALRLSMNIGDNNDLSTAKRSCRIHRKSRKGCANCKARRVKVPQTQTIPTALAMRHIGLFGLTYSCHCEV
jgi:hypothetical protein